MKVMVEDEILEGLLKLPENRVRSATLDTWLPEQVAFIQSMGNEKANKYWEAELPPKYDRVGIENFIRAKYADKDGLQGMRAQNHLLKHIKRRC
ncbi:hypothetical protein Syun_013987 [Stephania yunnanensis]|uniref:Arf-GAP domain-containing protein n=1 Tax=Stephania yunnanensis TaxID=152371 RepID=A0AAP0JKR3_9MAGN